MNPPATLATAPLLLRIGRWASLIWGALIVVVALGIPAGFTDTSQISAIHPGNAPLRAFFLAALISGMFLLLIYRGLSRRRPWTRALMVAFWAYCQVLSIAYGLYQRANGGSWSMDFTAAIFLVITVAYLFFKPNVVAYFRSSQGPPGTTESVA